MNKVLRNPVAYLIFVVPALALYVTFYIVPLFSSLRYSVTSWNGINEPVFNGIENFIKVLQDEKFWIGFKNNVYFVGFSLIIQVPIIIIVGIIISRAKRMLGLYKVSVFLPSVLSTAAVGIIWQFIYQPDAGLLNQLLRAVGLDDVAKPWLGTPDTAMTAVLVANAWQWTGFYIVLVLAAIFAIPSEVLEAAEIDGAVGFKKAWHITVPLIRSVIVVVMLLSITGAMKALDIVLIMTSGGPFGSSEVMATYMYKQAYSAGEYGYANAIAIIIFVFTSLVTLIFHLFSRRVEEVKY